MKVDEIVLRSFRNYTTAKVAFSPTVNLLVGENAQGKTNILEAIYFAALGTSHRSAEDADMVAWQEQSAAIELKFVSRDIDGLLQIHLFSNRRKQIRLNGQPAKMRDIMGTLNVVLFSPEDLWLIKGAPAVRRRFLDNEISQANKSYYQKLLRYQHSLLQRNNLLKAIRDHRSPIDQLDIWDEQLATLAAAVTAKRLESLRKLNMLANLMHRKLTNGKEGLTLHYTIQQVQAESPQTASEFVAWYQEKLAANRQQDIARGSTSVGPHRDDVMMEINGQNLRAFGSQGQQRTGALALKLAELEFIKSETGEYPILLLDDVMSELDASRREHLLGFIKNRIQTFITATDATNFPASFTGRKFIVNQGTIQG
ncbi:recombinase RecF [Anaerosporomusa subterranea]|uniref:DNA replication and repair protein RecF n=1 Tax=Anaerosporomusa subterranea TaxID=1794912 RepID=A0A154BP86_ANASB|nr:DNA replication/repair protein RecF [Anaerosporomusa subterranea]KYZ75709.1 recombinase RecF [Anaerosporomusa subterranea]